MNRRAFTLVEVALAMAVLTVGLTAVTAVYLTALRWTAETRHQFIAIDTAQQVLREPALLSLDRAGGTPAGFSALESESRGFLNGLYLVRRRLAQEELTSSPTTAQPARPVANADRVRIEVYAGGTDEDGDLVFTLDATDLVWRP